MPQPGHYSVRPAFTDDTLVSVRLRPQTLALLRAGMEVRHLRLDIAKCNDATGIVYDLYVETSNRPVPGAVPAWQAPHSPGFVPAIVDDEDHDG